MKKCPTCGCIVPPEIQMATARQQKTYELIARHPAGISREEIMRHVYDDDPNGGPLGKNVISDKVESINKLLKRHKMMIRTRRGPGAVYRLEAL